MISPKKDSAARSNAGAVDIALHRVASGWGEGASNAAANEGRGATSEVGDATWLHRFFDTDSWTAPGGDFADDASASVSVGAPGPYTWADSPRLAADVQGLINS